MYNTIRPWWLYGAQGSGLQTIYNGPGPEQQNLSNVIVPGSEPT